jgi:ABC-type branched-subunit amino acid transport system ATPase component
MLLVQQNPPFALKLADYVCVMSKGRSVYEPPPQILAQNEDVKARHLERFAIAFRAGRP